MNIKSIVKIKFQTFFLITIFPLNLTAQTLLTQQQIAEDITIFQNILINSHPSLYAYTLKPQWDSIFTSLKKNSKQLKSAQDLFRSISPLGGMTGDGHLRILHPKMTTLPAFFPVLLKIIDGKLYTDTEDFDIPLGSEIQKIDGITSQEMIKRMLKYTTSDGYNSTRRYRKIESEFGILHYYEFGKKGDYTITYKTPKNQLHTLKVKSQPFQLIKKRNAYRNSYFAAYHRQADKLKHFKDFVNQKSPFVYFIDSTQTAVLTANSFGIDPKRFLAKLSEIFKEIKQRKVTSLVIDVRRNPGGFRANAVRLFSFITKRKFKQRISESAITSTLVKTQYLKYTMADYGKFFKNYFNISKKVKNRWVLTKDRAEGMMKPHKYRFKGKVQVLIGGETFSAASAFALNVKNNKQIKLIGEEAGGGYYFHTGQFPVLYELPHSKILLNLSLVKVNHYVKDKTVPKGSGILPDFEVKLSQQDLIQGVDRQLDYALQQLKKK